jgi:hypothetical protein
MRSPLSTNLACFQGGLEPPGLATSAAAGFRKLRRRATHGPARVSEVG